VRLPARLGGTSRFGREGYDRAEEVALRAGYGEGAYNPDRESDMGRYRYARAVGLAWADVADEIVLHESSPPRSIHLLSEWEADLGLTDRSDWTDELRQERLRARCAEPPGNNPATIKIAFETLTGQTVHVVEGWEGGMVVTDDWRVLSCQAVVFEDGYALWLDARMWGECLAMARRMQPAHGVITPVVTHDGAAIAVRKPLFRCFTGVVIPLPWGPADVSRLGRDCFGA
jgi:hypothetical protein